MKKLFYKLMSLSVVLVLLVSCGEATSVKLTHGEKMDTYDLGDNNMYELHLSFTKGSRTDGCFYFQYTDDNNCYKMNFSEKGEIILNHYSKGKCIEVGKKKISADLSKKTELVFARNKSAIRIYINDEENFMGFPKFDTVSGEKSNLFGVDYGDGNITVSDLKVTDYTGVMMGENSYINPVCAGGGADPYILLDNGIYYLYGTNAASDGFYCSYSEDLKTWKEGVFCAKEEDIYGTDTPNGGFWAPEVYKVGDTYYMLYSVDCNVGYAISDSPLGPFKSPEDSYLIDVHAIDAHVYFDEDGKTYLYYVGMGEVTYGIYVCEFDFSDMSMGESKLIITAEPGTWEADPVAVAEGPFMIKHNGMYYLTYSGTGYDTHNYALGMAISDSPMGPFTKYSGNPFLKQSPDNGVYGPGHHAFFTTKGGELMIVYHRHASAYLVHPRPVCIDRVRFVEAEDSKYDIIEVVGPTSTPQKLPK